MSAFELMVQTQVQDMRIAGKTAANTAKSVRSDTWGGDKEVYEIDCIRVAARIPC